MWERLRSKRQPPDYCALVEGAVMLARSTTDTKLLLAGVAEQMGDALALPRLTILRHFHDWTCAAEYSAAGLNATTGDKLRPLEIEVARQLAHETAPVEVAISDLKPALRADFEQAFKNIPPDLRGGWLVFAPLVEGAQVVGTILSYRLKLQRLTDDERHALRTLAAVLALALHHQQSLEQAGEAAQREELTHQLLAAIRNAGSVEEVHKAAVDGLGMTLDVSRVVIFMGEGDMTRTGFAAAAQPLGARAEYRQSALVPSLMGSALDLSDSVLRGRLLAGDIIVIPDTGSGNDLSRASFVRLGVRALVLAPIAYQGRLVAALALEQFDQPRHFTGEALRLIRLVAEQMAAAMDKVALYHEAQENARRESLIRRINATIHRSLDADVLQTIVNELGTALGVCRSRLALLPDVLPQSLPITHEYVADCCKGRKSPFIRVPTANNPMLQVLMAADAPVIIEDPLNDPRLEPAHRHYREAEVKSVMFASIRSGGRPIGVFALHHCEQPHQWTPSEIAIVQSVAEQAAVAMRQSELYKEVRESATRAALVNQIVASIRRSLDLKQTLAVAVEEVGRALGANRTSFRQIIGDKGVVVAEYMTDPSLTVKEIEVSTSDYMAQEMLRTRRPMIFDDLPAFIRANAKAAESVRLWRLEQLPKSLMSCPIFVNDECWGALTIGQTDRARQWTASEVALVEEVCAQVAVAVSHSRLFEETRQAAERAALISQIIHGINQSNHLDEIFPIVAEQLGKHLAADRLTITRRQEESQLWVNECEYGDGKVTRSRRTYKDADTGGFNSLLDGDVIRCDDTLNDKRLTEAASTLLNRVGTRSFASVHIALHGESHLTISALMRSGPRRWTDEEIALLRAVANQVRIALQRAELFDLVSQGKFEWEATFDALTDGVFIFDENGILRRVNQTAAALEGATVGELIGRRCCELLQGVEGEVCRVSQVLETSRPHTYELSPERLKRPVLVTIAPLGTDFQSQIDGATEAAPRGAVCIVRELSELRAAEAVAREQRNFLVKLIEHANDSIFALSPNGRFIWFNEQLIRQSGFSRDTLKSVTYLDCVPESEKPLIAERFRRAMAGAAQSFEIRTFRRNSESRLMLMTLTPIYDEGGVTSILAIARDITEERVASERAAQADKLRALGQLASGVAHNFNNILAAILGHAQLLKREASEEHLIARLDIIENAALDGAQTVKRIQGFGLQQGDETYESFDVNQLLQDSTTLTRARWQHEAQARGLKYDVALDLQNVPFVRGTASELREVFVNIILNALDAMPQGGRLRISTKHKNGFVRISFSDSGVGMTREVRQRIFEPFFTTKGVTGMGLGLAVSYSIIERHGGEIDVRSIPGRGTTFTVALPSSRSAGDVINITDSMMTKTARVLVVDDDDRVRDVLVGMLKLAGHAADFATNGREALGRLERESFDLVFTDLSMPDVDGWALAEEIRRRWPQLKIVMVTGYAVQAESDRRRYQLVNDIISKPIRFDDINATLSHVLA
ncbi:MAG TPA: GAF domain-containing protein [Blastocatellia bacterium]|nr:GAF domain-containing protein [Blastocatellia bacterium]